MEETELHRWIQKILTNILEEDLQEKQRGENDLDYERYDVANLILYFKINILHLSSLLNYNHYYVYIFQTHLQVVTLQNFGT